jgi:hypothetical protein
LEVPNDNREQVVKVVSDAASELTDRVHLLGLEQLLSRLTQPLLSIPTFRDVLGDFCEPDETVLFVTHGVDYDAGPEAAVVFLNV